ncbi:TonB-dependent receptor [Novosphingobium profundi]|uniref:TonB-dependent receptor n=1 Tax=Novosphingobium profundi TaxID=1774954 RepID=UPI001BDAFD06|nr:TonB-dependent receptor [Novosphingobium profundi]MBT0670807.1 TonB-dependent receptor [Novosphingobium profundi]
MQGISKKGLRCALLATASAATLFAASNAQAQDAEAPKKEQSSDDAAMREIIVTAQFRSQKLQDTPLAITAVDSALLEARNQTDVSQIAAQAPNVQMTQMGGAFGSSMAVYIRGIGQYDFNPAYEPGVGMYIDDVYYATLTGNIMDLLDVERVEVLRGPQGTLTGRNSIGGAIKMYSIKPEFEDSAKIDVVYGARERVDLRASMNFGLTDNLFARVAGVYKHQNGYVDQVDYGCANPDNALGISGNPSTPKDCVVDKLGERNYAGIRGSLRFNPSDDFDWIVTGDYTWEHRNAAAGVLTQNDTSKTDGIDFTCGRFCTYASWYMPAGGQATEAYYMPNSVKFWGWGVSSDMSINLADNINLKSITAYREYEQIYGTDDDYTPNPNIGGAGFNDLTFRFFSQELRLNASIGDLADLTVGGFYSDQKSVYFTRQDIRYIGHGLEALFLQFQGDDPIKADSKAVFGTAIFHPAPGLNVTAGVRYTKEHKDYTFVRKAWDGGALTDIFGVGALDGTVANYDGDRVDYRLSVDYRFSEAVLGYATISTGFKGGGVTARPFTQNQAVNGTFDPETLTAYEVGLKTDLFGRRLRVNVAAFYNDYKNIQLPLADCAILDGFEPGTDPYPCAAIGNAGDGEMYGAELEITASPVDGLDIDGSLSWIDGEWKRIGDQVGGSITLGDPITTPNWRGSFGIQYRGDMGTNGSITPRFDIAYTGKQNMGRLAGSDTLDFNPARAIANARLTWRNENDDLAISFEVQNLFDKYYFLPIRFAALYASAGTTYSNVGRPREWAFSVQKKF